MASFKDDTPAEIWRKMFPDDPLPPWIDGKTPGAVNWVPKRGNMLLRPPTYYGGPAPMDYVRPDPSGNGWFGLKDDTQEPRRWLTIGSGCNCGMCEGERAKYAKAMTSKPTDDKYGDLPIAIVMLLEELEGLSTRFTHNVDLYVNTEVWSALGSNVPIGPDRKAKFGGTSSNPIAKVWFNPPRNEYVIERMNGNDYDVFTAREDPGQIDPVRLVE